MGDLTFPQLLAANWPLIAIVLLVVIVTAIAVWASRRRHHRRLPTVIEGVRIELQGVHLDDDLVVECKWRLTFIMTNSTKRPAPVPLLSSRGIVRSGRKQYAGTLYFERDAGELNPDEAMVAWVLCQLPGGGVPERVGIEWVREARGVELVAQLELSMARGLAEQ